MVSASEESVVGVMVFSPKYKSNSASATFASSIVYETSSGNVVSAEIEICRNNELAKITINNEHAKYDKFVRKLDRTCSMCTNMVMAKLLSHCFLPFFFKKLTKFLKRISSHVKDFLPKQTHDKGMRHIEKARGDYKCTRWVC